MADKGEAAEISQAGQVRGGPCWSGPILHDMPVLMATAATSATRDGRFSPIVPRELPRLHVGVSLLRDFERAADHLDWEVGRHGIVLELQEGSQHYRATFLPEIAKEQGWDREDTLRFLLRKSGYRREPSERLWRTLTVTRYQSSRASLSHAEYLELGRRSKP